MASVRIPQPHINPKITSRQLLHYSKNMMSGVVKILFFFCECFRNVFIRDDQSAELAYFLAPKNHISIS